MTERPAEDTKNPSIYERVAPVFQESLRSYLNQLDQIIEEGNLFPIRTRQELNSILSQTNLEAIEDPHWELLILDKLPEAVQDAMEQHVIDFFKQNGVDLESYEFPDDVQEEIERKIEDQLPTSLVPKAPDLELIDSMMTEPFKDVVVEAMGIKKSSVVSLALLRTGAISRTHALVNGKKSLLIHYLIAENIKDLSQEERKQKEYAPSELTFACIAPGDKEVMYHHEISSGCAYLKPLDRKIEPLPTE